MKKLSCMLLSFCILHSAFCILRADVIHVPDDFETIQAAIDAAGRNDTIQVAEGRYEENLSLDDSPLCLFGNPDDPRSVIIDGGGNRTVITITGGARRETVIAGFRITGGNGGERDGGGIHMEDSGPTLRDLRIEGNEGGSGGGIYVEDGNPPIQRCFITSNIAQGHGGGVYLLGDASPEMEGLVIQDNISDNRGGGIASFSRGRPTLDNSEVWHNTASIHGGGIYTSGVMFLENVLIRENRAEQIGGGLYANGNLSFINGQLMGNEAGSGGGAYLDGVRPNLERLLIANNQAADLGGGLYLSGEPNDRCSADILHVTFANNLAGESGQGIYCHEGGRPSLINCILWDDAGEEVAFNEEGNPNAVTLSYCDVQQGRDGVLTNDNGDLTWGAGSIDRDPLFTEVEGVGFHLSWENYPAQDETRSPCIDAGHPDLEEDPDGTRADIGCYPFFQRHPVMEVEPQALDFGEVFPGEQAELSFTIRNTGNDVLTGRFIYDGLRGVFLVDSIVDNMEGLFSVEQGNEGELTVRFEPRERMEYNSGIELTPFDPFNRGVFVVFTGEGGNRFPVVSAPVEPVSLLEDSDWMEIADLDTVFDDPEGDEMVYTAFPPANVSARIDEDNRLTIRPSVANFNGGNLRLIVRADDGYAENIQQMTPILITVNVLPVNDPPLAFHLLSPAEGTQLPFHEAIFTWSAAPQNQWETDEVRYSLELIGREAAKLFHNLTETSLILDLRPELREIGYNENSEYTEITWRVIADDDSSQTISMERFTLWAPHPESILENPSLPTTFAFGPAHPNPFNAVATLNLALPDADHVMIVAFNLTGERVAVLLDERRAAGWQRVIWNAEALPAGTYLLRCRTGKNEAVAKVALVR